MRAYSDQDCPEGMICVGNECVEPRYNITYDPATGESLIWEKGSTGSIFYHSIQPTLEEIKRKELFDLLRKVSFRRLYKDTNLYKYMLEK